MRSDFDLSVSDVDSVRVIRVSGEVDMWSAPMAQHALEDALNGAQRGLVLDLSALRFIDSSGIRMLIAFRERVHGAGASVRLTLPPTSPLRKPFQIVELHRVIPVDEDVETAAQAIRGES